MTAWGLALCLAAQVPAPPAVAVPVETKAQLPRYAPKNDMERAGVAAALAGLKTLGEGATVGTILSVAPHLMGVSASEGERVKAQLEARYGELDDDPRFDGVPSPLRGAFVDEAPLMIVVPPRTTPDKARDAPVVLFLHGYGGNGKLYPFLLSRALPHHWIVAPSHGLSWAKPRKGYVDDALATFRAQTGARSTSVWLVGLSSGGVGGYTVLARHPKLFRGYVSVVGSIPPKAVGRLPKEAQLVLLNGKKDAFVSAKKVRARWPAVKRRVKGAHIRWFDGGHYFLLDDDGAALDEIRAVVVGERAPKGG